MQLDFLNFTLHLWEETSIEYHTWEECLWYYWRILGNLTVTFRWEKRVICQKFNLPWVHVDKQSFFSDKASAKLLDSRELGLACLHWQFYIYVATHSGLKQCCSYYRQRMKCTIGRGKSKTPPWAILVSIVHWLIWLPIFFCNSKDIIFSVYLLVH